MRGLASEREQKARREELPNLHPAVALSAFVATSAEEAQAALALPPTSAEGQAPLALGFPAGTEAHARWAERWWRLKRETDQLRSQISGRTGAVAQVFDRFWRADPSRKDASLHVGLALRITSARHRASWEGGGVGLPTGGRVRGDHEPLENLCCQSLQVSTIGDNHSKQLVRPAKQAVFLGRRPGTHQGRHHDSGHLP